MSASVTGKAELQVEGHSKRYFLSKLEVENEKIGRMTLRNILCDIGVRAEDPGAVKVRMTSVDDPSQGLDISADEIMVLAEQCVLTGRWTTGIGAVAKVALASPADKEAADTTVSKTSRGKEYSSHWKVCLRWCAEMRTQLLTLPAPLRVAKGMAELANEDMEGMFILKMHITALEEAMSKVCGSAGACTKCC